MTLNIETVLAGAEENGNLLAFPDGLKEKKKDVKEK